MPTDPDNPRTPMHDLLKAYARQRRQAAEPPQEMHPATRRLLQSEVRRQRPPHPAPAKRPYLPKWMLSWRALAVALGVFTLLGVSVWNSLHQVDQPIQLAKQSTPTAPVAPAAATSSADEQRTPAPRNALHVEDKLAAKESLRTDPASPRAPTAPRVESLSLAESPNEKAPSPPGQIALEPKSESTVALNVAPAQRSAATDIREARAVNRGERYLFRASNQNLAAAQVAIQTAPTTPFAQQQQQPTPIRGRGGESASVLARFELEQRGNQVRVIDADGSVYDGYLYTPAGGAAAGLAGRALENEAQRSLAPEKPPPGRGQLAQGKDQVPVPVGGPAWNFRVLGTNRTLQEPVELDGLLVPETSAAGAAGPALNAPRNLSAPAAQPGAPRSVGPAAAPSAGAARSDRAQSLAPEARLVPLTNLSSIQRIQGTLRVGTTNRLSVDAFRSPE
jgi:hypothetical protein